MSFVEFQTPDITGIAKRYLNKFGQDAVDVIVETLKKIGETEERNTSNRLFSRSTANADIFERVGEAVFSEIGEQSKKNVTLLFGSAPGPGSRGANIASILARGKKQGPRQSQRKFATPAKKSGTGHKIFLPEGYRSPERKAEPMFFPRAQQNIMKNIEKKIPEALRKAFDEVKV
jgi:hypothetical protein